MISKIANRWRGYTMFTIVDDEIDGLVQADVNDGEDVAYVYNLNVDGKFRGKGYGKALLDEIEKFVPNITSIELTVDCQAYALIRWYESLGYVNTEVKVWHEGTREYRYILRKKL